MTRSRCKRRKWLLPYIEGELVPEHAAELELHLGSCTTCASDVRAVGMIAAALRAPNEPIERLDLVLAVREGMMPSSDLARNPRRAYFGVSIAACAAAAIALILPALEQRSVGEFRVKTAAVSPKAVRARVTAYRVAGDDAVAAVGESIANDQALAFAYSNRGEDPYPYLMVLAVDGARRVHWYYPAHLDEAGDPLSIPIAASSDAVELPEKVAHDLAPGTLRIYGLFSTTAIRVSDVERALEGTTERHQERLAALGAAQRIVETEVKP